MRKYFSECTVLLAISAYKKKLMVLTLIALFSMSFNMLVHEYPPDANNTGSPGDGAVCTDCHGDYSLNSGTATTTITSNIPDCGYVPGNTYTITASISRTGGTMFQFEFSPQNILGTYLGTLIPGANTIIHPSEPKDIVGTSASINSTNGQTWIFTWTAPAVSTGAVTFYAVFNDADGNSDMEGDYIYTKSLTVSESGPFVATIAPTNASCNSLCNGSAAANICSGTAPYTYTWNTGATSSAITGLCAGAYTVVVTDAVSASAASTVTITQPAAVTAIATASAVSCYGGNNGSVTAVAGGGTPAYSYSWSSGHTTAIITGLSPITLTVSVTDASGCSQTTTVVITEPAAALTSTMSSTTQSVSTPADGSATATPSGGISPYTYTWVTTPVQTTQTATGLVGGNYTVTITDANGCTHSDTITVNSVVGIAFANLLQSVIAYPNPTTGDFYIEINALAADEYALKVMDVSGKIVYSEAMQLTKGKNIRSISPATECKGVFFLQLKSQNGMMKVIPLVKLK